MLIDLSPPRVITLDLVEMGNKGEWWHEVLSRGLFGAASLLGVPQDLRTLRESCWDLLTRMDEVQLPEARSRA